MIDIRSGMNSIFEIFSTSSEDNDNKNFNEGRKHSNMKNENINRRPLSSHMQSSVAIAQEKKKKNKRFTKLFNC